MATKKTIFVAFAIEDERQRDFLKGQSLNTNSPFEYVDMSVKEAYDTDWKNKVRTRIKRSDGVIALISSDSLTSVTIKAEVSKHALRSSTFRTMSSPARRGGEHEDRRGRKNFPLPGSHHPLL